MTTEKKRVHLIFGTQSPDAFNEDAAKAKLRKHFEELCEEKGFDLEVSHILADHVHLLVALPEGKPIAEVVKTLKGESSRWINLVQLTPRTFNWSQGDYTNLPVSEEKYESVRKYILDQQNIHKKISYEEEKSELTFKHIILREE